MYYLNFFQSNGKKISIHVDAATNPVVTATSFCDAGTNPEGRPTPSNSARE